MSDFEKLLPLLLGSVFGHVEGDVTIYDQDSGEECVASSAASMMVFIRGATGHVFASLPSTHNEPTGIVMAFTDRDRAMKVCDKIDPSFVITSANSIRLVYLLTDATLEVVTAVVDELNEGEDQTFYATQEFPLPYGDFSLPVEDEAAMGQKADLAIYTLAEFETAIFSDGPDHEPGGGEAPELSAEASVQTSTMNDAEVYGDIPKAILDLPIRVSIGREMSEKVWTTSPETPFGLFLESKLTKHLPGKKDGECFVTGAVADKRRNKNSVTGLYLLGLDVDSGESMQRTFDTIRALELFTIMYTTHSHGTTQLRVKQDKYYKWAETNGEDTDPSDDSVKKFLTDEGKYKPDVIASAVYEETIHDSTGMQLVIATRPIDKFRILFPLETPYIMAEQKMAQRDAIQNWENMILGMGAMLGIAVDRAARDPSRLFFYPRHDKATKNYRIIVNAGKALDWRTITKVNPNEKVSSDPFDQAGAVMGGRLKGRTMSPTKGIDLMTWAAERADGFLIHKVFEDHCSDRLRGEITTGKWTVECPFDDDHSNAGDIDDKGCYIEDAGLSADQFAFKCRHDACTDRDRLKMLEKAMNDGWFPDDVLTADAYDCMDRTETETVVDEDTGETKEEPKHKDTTATYDKAIKMAEAATNKSTTEDIKKILELLVQLSQFDRARVLKVLDSSTKIGLTQLQGLLKAMERQNPQEIEDEEYDAASLAETTKKRFRTLKKEKKPIVIINESHQPGTLRDFVAKASLANKGRPERTVRNKDGEVEVFPAVEGVRTLFDWGTNAIRCTRDDGGNYLPKALDKPIMRDFAHEHMRMIKLTDANSFEDVLATDWLVEQAIVNKNMARLKLDGFATLPYYNRERELVLKPGYDTYSQRILRMTDEIANKLSAEGQKYIKFQPSWSDVQVAKSELMDMCFGDFPFDDGPESTTKGRASKAHLMCMMLQPIVRMLIEGPTPFYIIDKPEAGTGATLLAEQALYIATGQMPNTKNIPDNEDEVRKNITAEFASGREIMLFDNVNNPLVSGFYANLATAAIWSDRILGQTEITHIKNTMLVAFAGNNIRMSEEIARRALMIRLNLHKDPTLLNRSFRIPNLKEHVSEHQLTLFGYLLTMVNYWIGKGAPIWEGSPLVSFENYCKIMGGLLQTVEIEGFLDNRHITSNENSVERMAWGQFVRALKAMQDKNKMPWLPIGQITDFYRAMPDAPTLVVNGGGRVMPTYDDNKIYSAFQNVFDKMLGRVFVINSESGDEIEVAISRRIDKAASKTLYGIHIVEQESDVAA